MRIALAALVIGSTFGLGCAASRVEPRTYDACDGGNGDACNQAGLRTAGSRFRNFVKAGRLYLRGCNFGSAPACANVANLFEAGVGYGYQDVPRAEMYYAKSCRMGYPPACDEQARVRSKLDRTLYLR